MYTMNGLCALPMLLNENKVKFVKSYLLRVRRQGENKNFQY